MNVTSLLIGIRLIKQGLHKQAEGWELFEKAMMSAGTHQLGHLLHAVESGIKTEVAIKVEPGTSGASADTPEPKSIHTLDGKYKYVCPICLDYETKSRNAMRAHIREVHMYEVLRCSLCDFTAYNEDTISKYECTKHI